MKWKPSASCLRNESVVDLKSHRVDGSMRQSEQKAKCAFTRLFHLQCQHLVGTGPTKIHGHDRYSGPVRHLRETKSRIDHEGGADDQHAVGPLEMPDGSVDEVAGHALA